MLLVATWTLGTDTQRAAGDGYRARTCTSCRIRLSTIFPGASEVAIGMGILAILIVRHMPASGQH